MWGGAFGLAAVAAGGGVAAWAVRGRSSSVFAPSVWRGPASRPALAITFDDGPSESTGAVLELLEEFSARATFFQCGANAERLPEAARRVSQAGHEIGNHTYSHARLWLRPPRFIEDEVGRAQQLLTSVHADNIGGGSPRWFRAPYGVRWPGLGAAQLRHGLTGVMWTTIGRDWAADADTIAARLLRGAGPGAILCLHDGRELQARPDIRPTVDALRRLLPVLRERRLAAVTLSELLGRR